MTWRFLYSIGDKMGFDIQNIFKKKCWFDFKMNSLLLARREKEVSKL
jgi:hypothetical protein